MNDDMEKLSLSSVIKISAAKSQSLLSKKQLPRARHVRFRQRKPWRVAKPRLEKRLLVKVTLDKALHVLSQHQTTLLDQVNCMIRRTMLKNNITNQQ
jgi:hypothetical protein